jgi:sugar O-acyltransferase (sialic acid O-acetyltransferase NeuD family)
MNNRLIIIGASGHGKVVADIAISMNKWKDIAFLDDNELIKKVLGLQVIGKSTDAVKYIGNSDIFVAVGNNRIREKIHEEIELFGANVPVLIHRNALIGTDVEIGRGTVIMAGVVINCCTLIGKGCIINTGSTIDHDSVVEDYVHISPGANLAGSVKVGKGSWIGIGSAISNNINITSGCKVGAGAVVVKDLIKPGTYMGVPARRV